MRLHETGSMKNRSEPLTLEDVPDPRPETGELLLQVTVCGVCHTELDEIEGRTAPPELPVIPGHQVIGTVLTTGRGVSGFSEGDRVGVGWIYSACGECEHCRNGNENLCDNFIATGRDADGGYAEKMTVPADYAVRVPDGLTDVYAAPLLCAGAIGYRSLLLTGIENGQRLGLTGFGASGHLVLHLVKHHYPETEVYVFARNPREREFALELGAVWAGNTEEHSPEKLHAIIDTTPAWKPVVEAMKSLEPGGRLVINAIRKEAGDKEYLENLDYERDLWMEKEIKSVANVTRTDLSEMLRLAAEYGIAPEVRVFPLEEANQALMEVKKGDIRGAKILRIKDRRTDRVAKDFLQQ